MEVKIKDKTNILCTMVDWSPGFFSFLFLFFFTNPIFSAFFLLGLVVVC